MFKVGDIVLVKGRAGVIYAHPQGRSHHISYCIAYFETVGWDAFNPPEFPLIELATSPKNGTHFMKQSN